MPLKHYPAQYTQAYLTQCSTFKLHQLSTSPHTKKHDLVVIAAELLQRKFCNGGKQLKYVPPTA